MRRYAHIIDAVYHQPWLITPAAHASIQQLIESRLLGQAREGTDICGEAVELPGMEIKNGIAHIPIAGVIGSRLSGMEKGSGAVDTGDIAAELDEAEASPEAHTILLDMDSPGGMVNGTPELAARIARASKPTYAFVNQADSAAYWLASATDGIFGTITSSLGSIGVYMPWIDSTRALDMRGYKVELIKAGQLKGTGFPGTPLTESQRSYLQARVDQIYGLFTAQVRARRRGVTDESMQGQSFLAAEAQERGLLDMIVPDKATLLSHLQGG